MGRYSRRYWPRYVPVSVRRQRAVQKLAKMQKAGRNVSPVEIAGRKITTTFWGDAWCRNLEAYSDFSNRLPRGRTYVRNGSVIDLQVKPARVRALVSGTRLYKVDIRIKALPKPRWTEIKGQCAGRIGSLVELLQGSLSRSVMEIVTCKGEGLFPAPREIALDCSCPDWAIMCKHVAATLYGIGARLDRAPELLFTLRGVDPAEMVEDAIDQPAADGKGRKGRVLASDELSSVFGVEIDMDDDSDGEPSTSASLAGRVRRAAKTRRRSASGAAKKKSASKRATGRTASAKRATTEKRGRPKTAATGGNVKTTGAKKAGSKRAAARKVGSKKAATKKAGSGKTATRGMGIKRASATKTITKKKATKKAAARTSIRKKAVSKKPAKRKPTRDRTANKKSTRKTSDKKRSKS
ncbi:MAG: hypothetical protein GF355_18210 [Candidatus Eisenbacteria bacterium]|nr:hypothetical protein [Candidatus Eisenbacteria bacterium]